MNTPAPTAHPDPHPSANVDRWAHRRAEPRPLVFLWTSYVAICTLTLLWPLVRFGASGHDVYRPVVRLLLVLLAVGACVMWPALRLSQPIGLVRGPRAIMRDVGAIVVPMVAVIIPQGAWFLADWPAEVIVGLIVVLASWTTICAALLDAAIENIAALERRDRHSSVRRAMWLALIAGTVVIGPACLTVLAPVSLSNASASGRPWMMISPVTAVLELVASREWSGHAATVSRSTAFAAGILPAVAAFAWGLRLYARRRSADHSGGESAGNMAAGRLD